MVNNLFWYYQNILIFYFVIKAACTQWLTINYKCWNIVQLMSFGHQDQQVINSVGLTFENLLVLSKCLLVIHWTSGVNGRLLFRETGVHKYRLYWYLCIYIGHSFVWIISRNIQGPKLYNILILMSHWCVKKSLEIWNHMASYGPCHAFINWNNFYARLNIPFNRKTTVRSHTNPPAKNK